MLSCSDLKSRPSESQPATAIAHPNIALIKYWGKRDVRLNLPAVGSLSITLDSLETRTRIARDAALETDEMTIGSVKLDASLTERHQRVLALLRERSNYQGKVCVQSHNNFPTGAGLASSASGFAAFCLAAARVFDVSLSEHELNQLTRQGSGSAPRSLLGGFVEMSRGELASGEDCVAFPLYPPEYFPLKVVIAIVSTRQKSVLSTEGMLRTQQTSPFWPGWVSSHAADLARARDALRKKDFLHLAEVSEHSCLKMHALAMAACPPLRYWMPATYAALDEIVRLREKGTGCFFTIDAGPQVKAICLPDAAPLVAQALAEVNGVKEVITVGLGGPARLVETKA